MDPSKSQSGQEMIPPCAKLSTVTLLPPSSSRSSSLTIHQQLSDSNNHHILSFIATLWVFNYMFTLPSISISVLFQNVDYIKSDAKQHSQI